MRLPLPAGLDIYLTGVKSHDSELRLTRYIIQTLKPGQTALDVGAHVGFYTLLMSHCVGQTGRVVAFEPSQSTIRYLRDNTQNAPQVTVVQAAIGVDDSMAVFYEYDTQYSEYNSTHHTHDIPVRHQREIEMRSLDAYCEEHRLRPELIKIDVEGGEAAVISGAGRILDEFDMDIVLEFRHDNYEKMYSGLVDQMDSLGYRPYLITSEGSLAKCPDVLQALLTSGLESDNFVFRR